MVTKFYSQWGEDKALLPIFGEKHKGYFVDVGAAEGIRHSNTYLFELLGWKGICIEPHRQYYPKLVKNRPNSICLDVGVWHKNAETSDFYATKKGTWSRFGEPPKKEWLKKLGHSSSHRKYTEIQHPKLRTLDHILRKYKTPKRFDLLSIDVENSETNVLKGFSLKDYMPRVVIIEDLFKTGFGRYFEKKHYTKVSGKKYQIPKTTRTKEVRNDIYFRDYEDAEIFRSKMYTIPVIPINRKERAFVRKWFGSPPKTVLDVGCGDNFPIKKWVNEGFDLWGIDIEKLSNEPNFRVEDAREMSFSNGFFDVVYTISTIEHIGLGRYGDREDIKLGDRKAVLEMSRVLKPDGVMVITTPFGQPITLVGRHRIYDYTRLKKLFSGFEILETEVWIRKREGTLWVKSTMKKILDHTVGKKGKWLGNIHLALRKAKQ